MTGLFQSIEIGRRALASQQSALQTIGYNIGNVNLTKDKGIVGEI